MTYIICEGQYSDFDVRACVEGPSGLDMNKLQEEWRAMERRICKGLHSQKKRTKAFADAGYVDGSFEEYLVKEFDCKVPEYEKICL